MQRFLSAVLQIAQKAHIALNERLPTASRF